jgi:hypothetical protein
VHFHCSPRAARHHEARRLPFRPIAENRATLALPRMIVVRRGGRGRTTLIDYQSFKAAYQRLLNGEEPPLLPSEERPKCVPKAEVKQFLAASLNHS